MFSHEELIEAVVSEGTNGYSPATRGPARQGEIDHSRPLYEGRRDADSTLPPLAYDLSLMRLPDGRLEWKD